MNVLIAVFSKPCGTNDVGVQGRKKKSREVSHSSRCNVKLTSYGILFSLLSQEKWHGRKQLGRGGHCAWYESHVAVRLCTAEGWGSLSWRCYLCILDLLLAIIRCTGVRSLLLGFTESSRVLKICKNCWLNHLVELQVCRNAIYSVLSDLDTKGRSLSIIDVGRTAVCTCRWNDVILFKSINCHWFEMYRRVIIICVWMIGWHYWLIGI